MTPTHNQSGALTLLHPRRGAKGRFSSLEELFRRAGADTLKKFGLYDDKNPVEQMAALFSSKNFGYGKDLPPRENRVKRSLPASWGPAGTADTPASASNPSGGRP